MKTTAVEHQIHTHSNTERVRNAHTYTHTHNLQTSNSKRCFARARIFVISAKTEFHIELLRV